MDPIHALVEIAQSLTTVKTLLISGIALTLYDWLLVFGDEVRYVWRGRKTWIFYLYIMNRIVLTAFRLWQMYTLIVPRDSKAGCIAAWRAETVLIMFLLSSSDIFIMLRVYALTLKNKFVGLYFGTIAVVRFAVALASPFVKPATLLDLPPVPIDAFNMCPIIAQFQFKYLPNALGTAFDLSAFLVVAWCTFHHLNVLKLSAVVRTIATEVTIYFLAMVALQLYTQLSFVLMLGLAQTTSIAAYTILNPILTLRFAVSLKRAADPDGGQEWRLEHFSSSDFSSSPSAGIPVSIVRENIEMVTVGLPRDPLQTREA